MDLLKWAGIIAIALATPWPAMAGEPQTCDVWFGEHTPCEINALVPAGGSTTAQLQLVFLNSSGSVWSWVLYATDAPSCGIPPPPDHWASFSPFLGQVPPSGLPFTYNVTVSMTAATLARGVHSAYACISVSGAGLSVVAVPINLAVDDVIFGDGFDA